MENVMAIDVGTGYAKAAIIYKGMKEPIFLLPAEMNMGMKSVAYVDQNGEIKMAGRTAPANCYPVHNIKTKLSQKFITAPVGSKTYEIETGKIYGEIAKELIVRANRELVEKGYSPVYKVVATFPSAFVHTEDPQKTTKDVETIRNSIESLEIDGNKIEVVKMLPEPVAAAYESICFERKVKDEPIQAENYNIAVFDLGHGTFDIAVVNSTGEKDRPFDVTATDGDRAIGGRVFDNMIFERLCKSIGHPDKIKLTAGELEDLEHREAVELKHDLSDPTTENAYRNLFSKQEGAFLDLSLTKSEFNAMIQTDLNTTFEKTVNVIERAKRNNVQIHEIILTGGSSRIPAIKEMLDTAFKKDGINVRTFRPEHAVVFGAARYAFDLEQKPITQHAEYSYGFFDESTQQVKFVVAPSDELPATSRAYEMSPTYCAATLRVFRSQSTLCTADHLDVKSCHEIWRYPFETTANQPHRFMINLDDTHNITVTCQGPDGKSVTKTKFDD